MDEDAGDAGDAAGDAAAIDAGAAGEAGHVPALVPAPVPAPLQDAADAEEAQNQHTFSCHDPFCLPSNLGASDHWSIRFHPSSFHQCR